MSLRLHPSCGLLAVAALFAVPAVAQERPAGLPPGAEAFSLFGQPLVPPTPSADALQAMETRLAEARAEHERNPGDPDALIWVGRRAAYLGRYREAIAIYGRGIAEHPDDPRMYRHRGHRFITVRQFDDAIADFEKAAGLIAGTPDEIEPDGIPNPRNTPTSTLQSNIWYHLGLAYYLSGRFDRALAAYQDCLKVSRNPDMLTATSHWLYMTLQRLGRAEEARRVLDSIHLDMDIIENTSYHRLLLMYKGLLPLDELVEGAAGGLDAATVGYGVGNWHLYNGREDEAAAVFRRILAGDQWAAFGYIAAEAELKRMGRNP